MTSKEKAIELVGKYNFIWFYADVTTFKPQTFDEHIYYSYSKQCALIAVDEIINVEKQRYFDYNNLTQLITGFKSSADFDENLIHIREKQLKSDSVDKLFYWQEVKHEIESL